MKFSRVIGKIDPAIVAKAERSLHAVTLELGLRYNNDFIGNNIGGDPLIFSLIYPIEHVATPNIKTAATDGKRYYWNPKFINRLSPIGLRIVCCHEALHAIYMHPQRRGSRMPKLWNIAVDFIVNGLIMEDFKARKLDPNLYFTKYLGKYMTLEQYAQMLKNPFAPIKGFEEIDSIAEKGPPVNLPKPNSEEPLTPEQEEEIEKHLDKISFFYADPNIPEEMKRPEKIYDYLYSMLPKCPACGKVGRYKLPKNKKKNKDKNKDKDKNKGKGSGGDQPSEEKSDQSSGDDGKCDHSSGSGDKCDHKGCDECGDGMDIFDFGGTLDDHIDTEETEEALGKRMSDAVEAAKRMAGYVPGSLEDELGKLTAAKITWQDIIRSRVLKARAGNGRNDWTRFRSRPMFCGLMVPKRKNYTANFICLLDTSGSMSKEDMAFGISQLQSLDERSEGVVVSADAEIYWADAIKIKNCKAEELSKIKPKGRGGTIWANFFDEYEKYFGKSDFLIIISDMYLMDTDIANMKDPGIDVFWLCTSDNDKFKPPFGKLLNLKN